VEKVKNINEICAQNILKVSNFNFYVKFLDSVELFFELLILFKLKNKYLVLNVH